MKRGTWLTIQFLLGLLGILWLIIPKIYFLFNGGAYWWDESEMGLFLIGAFLIINSIILRNKYLSP